MTDPLDALALELRATAPAAPARLRARVDAIAAQTPPARASWRAWIQPRRALLVAAPTALAAMLAVAIGHGLSSSPDRFNASRTTGALEAALRPRGPKPAESGPNGARTDDPQRPRLAPFSIPKASNLHIGAATAADKAANTPPPRQAVRRRRTTARRSPCDCRASAACPTR